MENPESNSIMNKMGYILEPEVLEQWRSYFSSADGDLFDIIENAIFVAACDFPNDFMMRMDRITEFLSTCKVAKNDICNGTELTLPGSKDTKESKDDFDNEGLIEIEIDASVSDQILKIKKVTDDSIPKADEIVLDSLRQLQQMPVTVEIMKETGIGKSVNALRKHPSKKVRNLARKLVKEWKLVVDAWLDDACPNEGAEVTPETNEISVTEEKKGVDSSISRSETSPLEMV